MAKLAELTAGRARRATRAAIGHTRWATHGSPTAENAHPHIDCTGRLALIHNGIIENHAELRAELEAAGHTLRLGHRHRGDGPPHRAGAWPAAASLAEATRAMLRRLRGAFSIAVVSADEPDTIVAARRSTPLVLGLHDGVALLASDIPALIGHTRQRLRAGRRRAGRPHARARSTVTTLDGTPVEPEQLTITWDLEAAQKGGYDDFMSKEMHEQPAGGGRHAARPPRRPAASSILDEMRLSADDLRGIDKVFIVACGSSYHAAPGGQVRH